MTEVGLSELPPALIASINPDGFLFAFARPETGRYIARHVAATGQAEELEYDPAIGRLLTVEERRRDLPPPTREVLPDEQLTVTRTAVIDPATGERRTRIDVADPVGTIVHSVEQPVYDPDAWIADAVLQQVLRQHSLPARYAGWSRDERVSHWAGMLHRWRRARGEDGGDEDDLYNLALVHDMEKIDPGVRSLLRDILTQVGQLEQTPADQAIAAFTAKTGIRLD